MEPWFDGQTAGLIGGLLGTFIGVVFGGIGGGIGGPLAALGKGRKFVLGLFMVGIVFGAFLLGGGVVALAVGQPFHVWMSIGMPGLISIVVLGGVRPAIKRQYDLAEQRKLDADAIRES